jgi:hypothetical protein
MSAKTSKGFVRSVVMGFIIYIIVSQKCYVDTNFIRDQMMVVLEEPLNKLEKSVASNDLQTRFRLSARVASRQSTSDDTLSLDNRSYPF